MSAALWGLLADLVLVLHAAFAAFVVLGMILILAGAALGWCWVRGRWFRFAHLAAIAVVAVQACAGMLCPLTQWENALRARAGDPLYSGTFIAHWLHRLLFYEAPAWVFTLVYTAFTLAVVLAWIWIPPRRR